MLWKRNMGEDNPLPYSLSISKPLPGQCANTPILGKFLILLELDGSSLHTRTKVVIVEPLWIISTTIEHTLRNSNQSAMIAIFNCLDSLLSIGTKRTINRDALIVCLYQTSLECRNAGK